MSRGSMLGALAAGSLNDWCALVSTKEPSLIRSSFELLLDRKDRCSLN